MKNYTNEAVAVALNIMLKSYCNRCGYELVISQPEDCRIRYDIRCRDLGVGRTHYVYMPSLEHADAHQILTDIINEAEKAFDEAARTKGRGGFFYSADFAKGIVNSVYGHSRKPITPDDVRSGRYPWSDAFAAYCKADVKATKRMSKFFDPDKTPEIKDVIFQDPATIVLWADGTKTVVRAQDEEYDPEKGLAMAICKKIGGNKWSYFNKFKHWLKKYKGDQGDYEKITYTTKVIKED